MRNKKMNKKGKNTPIQNIDLWKSFGVDILKKGKSKTKDFDKLFKGEKNGK